MKMTNTLGEVLNTILEVVKMLKEFFGNLMDELGIELKKEETEA